MAAPDTKPARGRSPRLRHHGRSRAAVAGLLAVAAAAGGLWWTSRTTDAPAPAPAAMTAAAGPVPVIIYLIDTLRADHLSAYGYPKATSPRIDALAKESVLFERATAAAPWTLPSISSLMTSRFPCEHGVLKAGRELPKSMPTLAEQLLEAGYSTASFYQNQFAGPQGGLTRGFQQESYRADLETLDLDTASYLQQQTGGPFFLYLHSMEPHATYLAPTRFIQRFGFVNIDDREAYRAHWISYRIFWFMDAKEGRPPGTTDTTGGLQQAIGNLNRIQQELQTLYEASVYFADDELGQTIDVLKARGIWDKALFILLADHGEELGDHGLWFHDQSVYEELIHVPLLVKFPGGAHAGTRISAPVGLVDVMPTILDYIGRPDLCAECGGTSLLPLVTGQGRYASPAVPAMRSNEWGYYRPLKEKKGDINLVVRDGGLKGIWNAEVGTTEVFDLAADPREQQDLAASRPTETQALTKRAKDWFTGCKVAPDASSEEKELDAETRERLRAHGYF